MLCIAIYIIISFCLRYASSTGICISFVSLLAYVSFMLQDKKESAAVLNQAFLQLCYSSTFTSVFE